MFAASLRFVFEGQLIRRRCCALGCLLVLRVLRFVLRFVLLAAGVAQYVYLLFVFSYWCLIFFPLLSLMILIASILLLAVCFYKVSNRYLSITCAN